MSKIQVECPVCNEDMPNADIGLEMRVEPFEIKRRTVYGHCLHCGNSVELEQFCKDSQWVTTRYRRFFLKPAAWQKVAEIPVPPVMMGNIDEKLEELVGTEA